jgi:hypothetical protein
MSTERLTWQGRREEARLAAERLKIQIEGLRGSIRRNLDPFAPILELQEDVIFSEATDFADAMLRYREVMANLNAIDKALGKKSA